MVLHGGYVLFEIDSLLLFILLLWVKGELHLLMPELITQLLDHLIKWQSIYALSIWTHANV